MLRARLQKFHRFLFYVLVLLIPVQLGKHFWPDFAFIDGIRVDYLSPTIYLTDIIFLLILIFQLSHGLPTIKFTCFIVYLKNQLLSKVVLVIYIIANVLVASSPWIATFRWIKYLEMGLLALYISRTKFNLSIITKLLLISGLLSAVLVLFQLANNGSLGGVLYWIGERSFGINTPGIAKQILFGKEYLRPYGTFAHPNVLAGYFVISLPFILELGKKYRSKIVYLLLIAVIWTVVIYLSGSAVALLVSLGILLQYIKIRSLYTKVAFGFIVFIVGFLLIRYESVSLTRRFELNSIALDLFKSSPLVGIGMNNFIVRMGDYANVNKLGFFFQPAHNIYLLILAEGGIIGFALFMWILYKSVQMFHSLPSQITKNNPELLSLIALLLLGLFDHYLLTLQQGQLLLALMIGLCLRHKKAPLFRL